MCGRFTLAKKNGELAEAFPSLPLPKRLEARYNIAPSQPVVAWIADPTPRAELLTWGLVPSWSQEPGTAGRLANARAETILEKASFKTAFRRKRCALPADGWYEWATFPGGGKQPMYFRRKDHRAFALAGLWDEWHDKEGGLILSCCLITTRPNALARRIHDRMPALLRDEEVEAWLNPNENDTDALLRMLEPVPGDDFEVYPVSPAVNRAAVEGPQLIARYEPPPRAVQDDLF
jgi:putative SOS response-associated peptidase YedK